MNTQNKSIDKPCHAARSKLLDTYFEIQSSLPGHTIPLCLFGDFLNTYEDTARRIAPILGITLTGNCLTERHSTYRQAGFPLYNAENYIKTLLSNGFKVALYAYFEKDEARLSELLSLHPDVFFVKPAEREKGGA